MNAENMGQRAAREMREAEDRRWGRPGSGRNVNIDAFEPSADTEDDRCAECDGKGELWNERRCGSCAGHGYIIHCAECTDRAVCNSTELTEDMQAKFCVSMRLANGSVTKRLVCGDSDCLGIVLRDLLLTATSVEKELARAQVEHDQQMRAAEANHRAAERSGLLEDAPTMTLGDALAGLGRAMNEARRSAELLGPRACEVGCCGGSPAIALVEDYARGRLYLRRALCQRCVDLAQASIDRLNADGANRFEMRVTPLAATSVCAALQREKRVS